MSRGRGDGEGEKDMNRKEPQRRTRIHTQVDDITPAHVHTKVELQTEKKKWHRLQLITCRKLQLYESGDVTS